jgi:hypothetical protein
MSLNQWGIIPNLDGIGIKLTRTRSITGSIISIDKTAYNQSVNGCAYYGPMPQDYDDGFDAEAEFESPSEIDSDEMPY